MNTTPNTPEHTAGITPSNLPSNLPSNFPGNLPSITGDEEDTEEDEDTDTRLVPKSLKIPAYLSKELDREMAEAGVSFNALVQNVLVNRHNPKNGAGNTGEITGMREVLLVKEAKILELTEALERVNDEFVQKGYSNNRMLGEISALKREIEEYAVTETEWETKCAQLEDEIQNLRSAPKPDQKSDVGEVHALRQIIADHTFLSPFDIEQLLHENSNY